MDTLLVFNWIPGIQNLLMCHRKWTWGQGAKSSTIRLSSNKPAIILVCFTLSTAFYFPKYWNNRNHLSLIKDDVRKGHQSWTSLQTHLWIYLKLGKNSLSINCLFGLYRWWSPDISPNQILLNCSSIMHGSVHVSEL